MRQETVDETSARWLPYLPLAVEFIATQKPFAQKHQLYPPEVLYRNTCLLLNLVEVRISAILFTGFQEVGHPLVARLILLGDVCRHRIRLWIVVEDHLPEARGVAVLLVDQEYMVLPGPLRWSKEEAGIYIGL